MNTKIKTLFFALFLVISASVNAQDAPKTLKKYEYVTVTQNTIYSLNVSYAGKPFEKIKIADKKDFFDHHELLEYVENLQNESWD